MNFCFFSAFSEYIYSVAIQVGCTDAVCASNSLSI